MFRRLAVAVTALAIMLASQVEAQATRQGITEVQTQQPPSRRGAWGSFGFGAGMEQVDLSDDVLGYSDPLWRPSFNFRVGGTVKQVLRLGVETFVWTNVNSGATETLLSVMPIIQIYPVRCAGINLRGGVGYAWSGVSTFGGLVVDNGFSTMVGLGWEFPISRKFFITPGVDWYQQWYGGGFQPSYTERVINISLSLGLQGG